MGSRGAVQQAGLALEIEPGHPPVGALAGQAHRLSHMGDRHVLLAHSLHEQTTTMKTETGVTVTHEDLRLVKTAISTAPEVFASGQHVTNVLAEYN